ncbi:MAG: KH domain-containing protein [SAR202 cluster bacterium]|nr:KH domain-containing protein [SAR202 cluster bacterium]
MKELVEFIAKEIASYPDEVRVTEEEEEDGRIILRLEVAPDDKGKVIGRQGRVADSIRVLLRVAAVKQGARATLDIV